MRLKFLSSFLLETQKVLDQYLRYADKLGWYKFELSLLPNGGFGLNPKLLDTKNKKHPDMLKFS